MSWAAAAAGAVAVGSWALNKYGGSKKEGGGAEAGGSSIDMLDKRNPDQKLIDSTTSQFIARYLPQYEPGKTYSGSFVAPTSNYETQGLEYLSKYLSGPDYTNLLSGAQNEISRTLDGSTYDPSVGPYYKAMRDTAMVNQRNAIDTVNRQTAGTGNFFSSERMRQVGEVGTNTSNYLNMIYGQLAEKERQRRLDVIPDAINVNDAITKAPLQKVAASQQYGALPRLLEQADLEAQYQDFIRKQNEGAGVLGASRQSNVPYQTVGINAPGAGGGSGTMDFLQPIIKEALPMILKTVMSKGAS